MEATGTLHQPGLCNTAAAAAARPVQSTVHSGRFSVIPVPVNNSRFDLRAQGEPPINSTESQAPWWNLLRTRMGYDYSVRISRY